MINRLCLMVTVLTIAAACGAPETASNTDPPTTTTTTTPTPTGLPTTTTPTTNGRRDATIETPEGIPIDVHAPATTGPLPVALLLHGSPPSTKEDVSVFADWVAHQGETLVYNVGWTEGGLEGVDGSVENVACAVAYARDTADTYGGDTNRITVIGMSAGGWSGATAALGGMQLGTDCAGGSGSVPDAFVGIAGAYSAVVDGPVAGMLAADPEALRASDPYTYFGENPTLQLWLIHGDADTAVPLSVSQAFQDALVTNGYNVELVVLENAGHPGDTALSPEHEEKILATIKAAADGG